VPRATISLKLDETPDEFVTMWVKEDIIDGFKGTEFDSEKVHSIGTHITSKKVTHLGEILRLARTIALLDDVKE
jgi:hypothetical protein